MVLEFPVLADYCVIAEGETAVYATHGHIYNEQKLPPLHPGDILLHGHTHVPKCTVHEEESYIYMNPGSVSLPKEDSWHAFMEKRIFHGSVLYYNSNCRKYYKCWNYNKVHSVEYPLFHKSFPFHSYYGFRFSLPVDINEKNWPHIKSIGSMIFFAFAALDLIVFVLGILNRSNNT